MGTERLSDEQVRQIVEAVRAGMTMSVDASVAPDDADDRRSFHDRHCRFAECEARNIHVMADLMSNGGADNLRALLEFGNTLKQIRKWSLAAIVAAIIGALLYAVWQGILAAVRGEWSSPWSS